MCTVVHTAPPKPLPGSSLVAFWCFMAPAAFLGLVAAVCVVGSITRYRFATELERMTGSPTLVPMGTAEAANVLLGALLFMILPALLLTGVAFYVRSRSR